MFTDPVTFYFIRADAHGNLSDDLKIISDQLGIYAESGFGLMRDENSLTIAYKNTNIKSVLRSEPGSKKIDEVVSSQMTLTCERTDNVSVNLLKGIVKSMGYRIFNPTQQSYSVVDPNLLDLSTGGTEKDIFKMLALKKMVPLYRYVNSLIFYAKKESDESVHLVNSHLLQAALDKRVNFEKADDFSVKVARDLPTFVALADRGLIPSSFYHINNQKKDDFLNINLSGFNVDKVERDLYVSPVFFEHDKAKQSFVSLNKKKNISTLDKIDKGLSLRKYIYSLVNKHKIGPLLAVKYPQSIEFSTDTHRVFPRMNISVFVGQQ